MAIVTDAAFAAYLRHLTSHLEQRRGRELSGDKGPSAVRPLPSAARHWFDEAEGHETFGRLANACARTLAQKDDGKHHGTWASYLQKWFRQGGVYVRLLEGGSVEPGRTAKQFEEDLRAPEKVTILALLEGVEFQKECMEFSGFQVFRPTDDDLEALFGIEANRIFYPYALTSTDRLTDHWYVRLTHTRSPRHVGLWLFGDDIDAPVHPGYAWIDPLLENALKRLVTWDWIANFDQPPADEFKGDQRWWGFNIPLVLQTTGRFRYPRPAPPVGRLQYGIYADPETGEEAGEYPERQFTFDDARTNAFQDFIGEVDGKLDLIAQRGERWQFIDVALSYLAKAFFSDNQDELLWHISALEAVLGENRPGLTSLMADRLERLYSNDKTRNRRARKAFTRLYDLRSKLVHGRRFKAATDRGELRVARTLARRTLTRMISLLGSFAARERAFTPQREDVLRLIELSEESSDRIVDFAAAFSRAQAESWGEGE